jgi:hypothetical protein
MGEGEAIQYLFDTKTSYINEWFLYNNSKELNDFFYEKNIRSEYDIIIIYIQSYHRALNSKDIDIEKLISKRKKIKTSMSECKKVRLQESVKNYKKYLLGDRVFIKMLTDTLYKQPIVYDCPHVNKKNKSNEILIIGGKLIGKNSFLDEPNLYFKIRIDTLNKENSFFHKGDEEFFELDGIKVTTGMTR